MHKPGTQPRSLPSNRDVVQAGRMKNQIPGNVFTIRGQSGVLDGLGVIALGILLL